MKNENRFAEWLGFQTPLNIENAKTLGRILGWILSVLAIVSVLFFVGFLVRMGMAILSTEAPNPPDEAIRNIGLALAAVVGLPFLVWRSIVAQQQVRVAEQGQITDRINKAVEGLGAVRVTKSHSMTEEKHQLSKKQLPFNAIEYTPPLTSAGLTTKAATNEPTSKTVLREETEPNIEVRLGAIYSLERIARDSLRDHISIMEILCAYVRENAKAVSLSVGDIARYRTPRVDIQAAITVIARRTEQQRNSEHDELFRLDLRGTDLSGIDFKEGDFSGAIFWHTKLELSDFKRCELAGTEFGGAVIAAARFTRANLTGAKWNSINLSHVAPGMFNGTNLFGLDLRGADFSQYRSIPPMMSGFPTFGTSDTKLNALYQDDYSRAMSLKNRMRDAERNDTEIELLPMLSRKLEENPFRFWVDLKNTDGTIVVERLSFRTELGLTGWPYDDI